MQIVQAQGGDPRFVDDETVLPRARRVEPIPSLASGFVTAIDTEGVGLAAVALGAGREQVHSVIDPAVGFLLDKKIGDRVVQGEPLGVVHLNAQPAGAEVVRRIQAAYRFGSTAPAPRPLVLERIE